MVLDKVLIMIGALEILLDLTLHTQVTSYIQRMTLGVEQELDIEY